MAALATYKLPTFLCQQSCDQNSLCTAFVMDAAQANCVLLQNENDPAIPRTAYWKVTSGGRRTLAVAALAVDPPAGYIKLGGANLANTTAVVGTAPSSGSVGFGASAPSPPLSSSERALGYA